MRRILVCTDFSDAAAAGLSAARERFGDAAIVLWHVVDDDFARAVSQRTGLDPTEIAEKAWSHADMRLEEMAAAAGAQARIARGDPVGETIAAAQRERAECIVLGVDRVAEGASGGRFRARLGRSAPVPVLLVFVD